jgi:hypothetical protein
MFSPRAVVRLRTMVRGLGVPRWGNLRRLKPFSDYYGFDRGTPIDRYYLDRFLASHGQAIHGDVLEIQAPGYVDKYGRNVRLKHSIDVNAAMNPTYVCDLAAADVVPSDRYDCFLLPNTLHALRDIRNCMRHMLRVVKPGGVVLAATAAMGPLETGGMDFWRMSAQGWQQLAADVTTIVSRGTATAWRWSPRCSAWRKRSSLVKSSNTRTIGIRRSSRCTAGRRLPSNSSRQEEA